MGKKQIPSAYDHLWTCTCLCLMDDDSLFTRYRSKQGLLWNRYSCICAPDWMQPGICVAYAKTVQQKLLPVGRRILHIAGFGSFAIFLLCVYAVDDFDAFLYQGGMLLFCLNAAILIACVCHPASLIGKWLSFQPLVWLGKRSYGIYLWHYPIIVLTTPVIEIGQPSIARVTLQLIAILLVAEASYRFIEQPIRQHGFRQYFSSWSIWKKESNSGLHLIRCSLESQQLF